MFSARNLVRSAKWVILSSPTETVVVLALTLTAFGVFFTAAAGDLILPLWFLDSFQEGGRGLLCIFIPAGLWILLVISCRFLARWVRHNRILRPR